MTTTIAADRVFDLTGPLPQGTTVLEASAGTGKTHTIAGLAVRYLAEGVVEIDQLMLVTFGRAATAELRERVRLRLTEVTAALADISVARASRDDLVRFLATADDADVVRRHRRLTRAVADFDAALISTTHGFCHQMLAGLGIAADLDADVTFAEATKDLVLDVATDLYVGDYGRSDSPTPRMKTFDLASRLASEAVGDPSARLEPRDAEPESDAGVRVGFADRSRSEVRRRKRAMRVMDYNDLLTYLEEALTHPETGEDACRRIRSRYQVVMVDEFQDTDPVQWRILERTFHGQRTVVLIGDPKQAIYAFRGADVTTYLLAKEAAEEEQTLGKNWRSDRPLVEGLLRLLGDAALGAPAIRVHDVEAEYQHASLVGAPVEAPVRVRHVERSAFGESTNAQIKADRARQFIAGDVAADIVRLLSSGAEIVERKGGRRPIQAADIAVLVQTNDEGVLVHDALEAVDVPVVLTGTSSVFHSEAARDWLALLTALEQPHRTALVRNVALTPFFGCTATELATADEPALEQLEARLRRWAELATDHGVAALVEAASATGLAERVLRERDGERRLTDLRHVGQALHQAASEGYAGTSSLLQWLQHRMTEPRREVDDERSRRLESDAKAVQVTTIWRAKGLEFPVVYAPFLYNRYLPPKPDVMRLHDDDGARLLDVGGAEGPGYDVREQRYLQEDAGESLRLAYVALTRARCQVIAHWAPTRNTPDAPLHRLLFGERSLDGQVSRRARLLDDPTVRRRLEALAAESERLISAEAAQGSDGVAFSLPPPPDTDLSLRRFDRTLDRAWSRTSYSGITAGLHEASGAVTAVSEPEGPGILDEPVEQLVPDRRLGVHQGLGAGVGLRRAAFDEVRRQREGRAGEPDQRRRAELGDQGPHRLRDVGHVVGLQRSERLDVASGADGLGDDRAHARDDVDVDAHGDERDDDVGEQDRGVGGEPAYRLQRDLADQLGSPAGLEHADALAQRAVLGQRAAGLPHEPHRGAVRALPPTGPQERGVGEAGRHAEMLPRGG